jgi:hypothetical protein
MTYFPDLSPYAYGHHSHPGVVHVGWLDAIHPFPQGTVTPALINKMRLLASKPVELYRGRHLCELCPKNPGLPKLMLAHNSRVLDPHSPYAKWLASRSSNGEVRVSRGGVTFAAPVLIVHNIEEHRYLPPTEFLKAVEDAAC